MFAGGTALVEVLVLVEAVLVAAGVPAVAVGVLLWLLVVELLLPQPAMSAAHRNRPISHADRRRIILGSPWFERALVRGIDGRLGERLIAWRLYRSADGRGHGQRRHIELRGRAAGARLGARGRAHGAKHD